MFLAALGASGLATFLASHITMSMSPWLPVLTAAPGIIVLAHGYFNFERKALWHFEKSRKLEAIFRKLDVGGITGDEAANRWNGVDDEMDEKWPGLADFRLSQDTRSELRDCSADLDERHLAHRSADFPKFGAAENSCVAPSRRCPGVADRVDRLRLDAHGPSVARAHP
jgi:hypothetical protein